MPVHPPAGAPAHAPAHAPACATAHARRLPLFPLLAPLALLALLGTACSGVTEPGTEPEPDLGPCAPGPYFTVLPVEASAISYFLLLGHFNPPGDIVPRSQTGLQLRTNDLTPLRAVGDVEIIFVERTRWLASPTREGHVDYSLTFEIPGCRAIFGEYQHIANLEPVFASALDGATCQVYSTESETLEACGRQVQIPVAAGARLGDAGGWGSGLDFDLFDRRVTFDFVAGHRYPTARWAICPQPLFVPALRDLLLSMTGRPGVTRTVEPRCGTMEIDLAGTAQGMWVLEGHDVVFSAATHDRFFALAPHELRTDTHALLVTAHPAFRHPLRGAISYAFEIAPEGRHNRAWRDLPANGAIHCATLETWHGEPLPERSLFMAMGGDGRVTVELLDHTPGESPCLVQPPEAWSFSSGAVRLMR